MITRKRLKELEKQCATIYAIEHDKIEVYDLSDKDIYVLPAGYKDGLTVFDQLGYWNDIGLEYLFEKREDAEWSKEFEKIPLTRYLDIPNWKKFKKDLKGHFIFVGFAYCHFELFIDETSNLILFDYTCDYEYFKGKASKNNYLKACRIAKDLYLGG